LAALIKSDFANKFFGVFNYLREEKDYIICEMEDALFAIFHTCAQTDAFEIDLKDYHLVIITPLKTEKITIKGKSILIIEEIHSENIEIDVLGHYLRIGRVDAPAPNIQLTARNIIRRLIPKVEGDGCTDWALLQKVQQAFQKGIEKKDGREIISAIYLTVMMCLQFPHREIVQDDAAAKIFFDFFSSKS
jgi:hypothetical protein